MKKGLIWKIVAAVALLGITACSSGGGDSTAGGGIGGTGAVAAGTITAKGSITVNGVKYETDGARVFIEEDEFGDDSRLRVGMVVEVEGTVNADGRTGRASVVRFNDSVEGPVTAVNASAGELEVLGQLVFVDDLTNYRNVAGIGALAVDDIVEVSGQFDELGNIRATFVEKKLAAVAEYEVTGIISGKNANTFTINSLNVDFGTALLKNFSPGTEPQNGDFVEVKGLSSDYTPATNTLVAASVENKAKVFDDGLEVEAEGYVRDLAGNNFTVVTPSGPQTVQFDGGTEFSGGTSNELQNGMKVEVEGPIAGGAILADKIEFKEGIRIEAAADGVDVGNLTIDLWNLSAVKIRINGRTRLDDKRGVPSPTTNPGVFLASIGQLDDLKIRGRQSGADILATELEVDDPTGSEDRVRLRGPVDSDPAGTFVFEVLGVTVDTTGTSENNFKDINDNPIGRSAFFSAVTAGTVVDVKGDLAVDNDLDASEVQLED
jgi:hypothetical protein